MHSLGHACKETFQESGQGCGCKDQALRAAKGDQLRRAWAPSHTLYLCLQLPELMG